MNTLSWFTDRSRTTAFLIFILIFMFLPPYAEKTGFSMNTGVIIMNALSAAFIYQFVVLAWPSLLFHIPVYYFLYKLIKNDLSMIKYFMLYTGFLYLLIAFGQGTAYLDEYGLIIITNNLIIILIIGLLWLRDYIKYSPSTIDRRMLRLLPLALFAYIAPSGKTGYTVPPWWGLWINAFKGNILSGLVAFIMDLIAGYGAVAYCLFTPLALVITLSTKAVSPLTMRLTALTGLIFAVLIWIFSGYTIMSTQLEIWKVFGILWNMFLHIPLLVICGYAFIKKYDSF